MKNLTSKLFTAAVAAIAVTTASAQVPSLKASVPFAFTAGAGEKQQAGDYRISRDGDRWYITNAETRHTALALSLTRQDSKVSDVPQMVFHCRANNCALYQVRVGGGHTGATFAEPKRSKSDANELAREVIVPLNTTNSD